MFKIVLIWKRFAIEIVWFEIRTWKHKCELNVIVTLSRDKLILFLFFGWFFIFVAFFLSDILFFNQYKGLRNKYTHVFIHLCIRISHISTLSSSLTWDSGCVRLYNCTLYICCTILLLKCIKCNMHMSHTLKLIDWHLNNCLWMKYVSPIGYTKEKNYFTSGHTVK